MPLRFLAPPLPAAAANIAAAAAEDDVDDAVAAADARTDAPPLTMEDTSSSGSEASPASVEAVMVEAADCAADWADESGADERAEEMVDGATVLPAALDWW